MKYLLHTTLNRLKEAAPAAALAASLASLLAATAILVRTEEGRWLLGALALAIIGAVAGSIVLYLDMDRLPLNICPDHGEWYGHGRCPTCDRRRRRA